MIIKMKTTAAGPQGVLSADKQYTVPDGLGRALCENGFAEELKVKPVAVKAPEPEPEPAEETADAEPVMERAVTRGRRGR